MAVEDSSQLSSPDVLQRMFSKKRKKRNVVIISDTEEEDEEENVRVVKRQKSPPNNNIEKNEDSFTEDEDDVVDLTNVKNKNDSTYEVLSSENEDVTTVQKRSQRGKKKDDSYDLSFVVDDDEIEYDYKPRNVKKKKKKKRDGEDEFVPSESEDTTSPKPFKQQRRKIRKKKIIESDDDDDDYEEGMDGKNLKPEDNTMWQCKRCTLLNNIALEYCTLCAGERPAKYSSIAREQQEMMTRKRFLERFKQKKKKTPQKQNKKRRRRRRLIKRGHIVDEEEDEEEEEEECTNFSTSEEDSSSEQEEDEEDMIEPLLQKCRDIELKLCSSHHDISLLSSTNLQGSLPHHLKSYQMIGLKWLYVCVLENFTLKLLLSNTL